MKPSPKKKGNELEEAVRAIENAILRSFPGYSESTFKIEGNRVLIRDGVRHEIDVYVTAYLATGYESIFIFECKNWDAKVGKNEIIVFSEKIAVSGAQRGFFVAKSFTKDAKAQARKDARIQVLMASNFEPTTRLIFPRIQLLHTITTDANVLIDGFDEKGTLKEIIFSGKTISINGTSAPADEYIKNMVIAARDAELNMTRTQLLPEGQHQIKFGHLAEFDKGDAFLDLKPIKTINISGNAQVDIVLGSVLSIYEVQSRGRMLIVNANSHGVELQAQIIEATAQ